MYGENESKKETSEQNHDDLKTAVYYLYLLARFVFLSVQAKYNIIKRKGYLLVLTYPEKV